MIEFCTKRRMITSIVGLGILTVVVLILEEKLTSQRHFGQTPTPYPNNNSQGGSGAQNAREINSISSSSTNTKPKPISASSISKACWTEEEFSITGECAPCTPFEINSGTPIACELTGLKEVVHCNISGTQYRSCSSIKSSERARFWVFESLMLLLSVVSYGYYKFRSSQIERATIRKIERNLAAGH